MILTNAAGTAKTVEAAQAVLDTGCRTVVLGSYALRERHGNAGTVDYFAPDFSLNVRGIPSPPLAKWAAIVADVRHRADLVNKRVVVSVAAFDPEEYATLTGSAFAAGAHAVELNFGCPNMQEGGTFAPIMSYRPAMVAAALRNLPDGEIWVKVSPIFDDALFDQLVGVFRPSGLSGKPPRHRTPVAGVVAVNTLPQCLALDDAGVPMLSFGTGVGGMAGSALKPIALAQAARWVREGFRVIGVGGIASGRDVRDYATIGVESCQANTIIQREGASALDRIVKEYADGS
jgi:dihydroorotate dehydrogenase